MISLILPYWNRQEAADKAFALLDRHYRGMDLEVVVVDDGNREFFKIPPCGLNVKVVRLPLKDEPKSPCVAWNEGVKHASGDIVIISCIEMLHDMPILQQMVDNLREEGDNGYILAAAYCPEDGIWHCHSTRPIPTCPMGTGITFCAAMYKSLYERVGGFGDEYRDGAGYEDRDFIWRLTKAGAKCVIRDDLVLTHPKTGATIKWRLGGFRRNEDIYFSKWPEAKSGVTFVCLKAGDAYGSEYVNILRDMIQRNMPAGTFFRFVCITDDIQGLADGTEVIPLPDDLETWWGKLYMFKRGLFRDGERLIFMDLDTVIIGGLHEIVSYKGQFATLRDFYHPQRLGPAIIAWEAGEFAASIWEEWVAQGKPRNPMGDLWWLNNLEQGRFPKKVDILQEQFPGKFVSFKAHCDPYPPTGASVVCFHGQPKPENCATEWVSSVWKIGGASMAELAAVANTASEKIAENVRSACARGLPWLNIEKPHDRQAVIVAGGPSLLDTIDEVSQRAKDGQTIIAVNGAARFLNENGVIPDIHVVIDSRPGNVRFINESKSWAYYFASQCDPALFDAAKPVTLFHMNTVGIEKLIPADREANLISSGTTVGLAAMAVAYCLGYRALHLHGMDSSYSDEHHAYEQPENDADAVLDVVVNGQRFKAAPWMVKQAQQFQTLATELANDDVVITVAGYGLLPYIARCMGKQQEIANDRIAAG
jgi:glycosyltransferase involved in cell wall biosynthesis/uncharacterized Rossmann fold enzyme